MKLEEGNVLSIVVPCFNEEKTIAKLVESVLKQKVVDEVIVIDDASTDTSWKILCSLKHEKLRLMRNENNKGKGFSIRKGLAEARCPIVGIQDADLEYDPRHYEDLISPIVSGSADAVFGSRFTSIGPRRAIYFWHRVGNRFLTIISNMFSNIDLTDMETCHKFFRTDLIQQLNLRENRFAIEPEIVIKLARSGARIFEVPISYYGRSYAEGKKITWKDGISALFAICYYGLTVKKRARKN